MIEITTLLLGLYVGTVNVAFTASPEVAAVVARLDGEVVAEVVPEDGRGVVPIAFGDELAPHELVLVGADAEGREVARAREWVNLPRSAAEARLVLHGDAAAPERATVHLETLTIERVVVRDVEVVLDDAPLTVEKPLDFALPELDPAVPHVLRVTVRLSNGEELEIVRSFGGGASGTIHMRLLPIRVTLREGKAGAGLEEPLAACLAAPPTARVEAVEEPAGGDVVFVRDLWALPDILRNLPGSQRWDNPGPARRRKLERLLKLGVDDRLRQMCPTAEERVGDGIDANLFAYSDWFESTERGVPWILLQRCTVGGRQQRLADAVAVAGLNAYGTGRPAVVVLVLGPRPDDESEATPSSVRSYLDDLGVPLVVWASRPRGAGDLGWGDFEDVSTYGKLEQAVERLAERLAAQRVAWLGGVDLPQRVRLADDCACCVPAAGR